MSDTTVHVEIKVDSLEQIQAATEALKTFSVSFQQAAAAFKAMGAVGTSVTTESAIRGLTAAKAMLEGDEPEAPAAPAPAPEAPEAPEPPQQAAASVAAPTPAAPPAPAVNLGELDSEGFPWDARIHSGGAKKTADGKWRKKRGVATELWEGVRTELRQRLAAQAPTAPAAPLAPQTAPAAPMPPQATEVNFGEVVQRVQTACGAKPIGWGGLKDALAKVGVNSIMELAQKPAELAEFAKLVPAVGATDGD